MKRYRPFKHLFKSLLVGLFLMMGLQTTKAQIRPVYYMNVDWQLNIPISQDFADKTSGWGMNFEGGIYLTKHLAVGPFLSFHTNMENLPRQTLDLGDGSALTAKQQHAIYQLPFGVTSRYTWRTGKKLRPYAGMKIGACYAEMSSYYYTIRQYETDWGFYFSPEIGCTLYPDSHSNIGIHFAMYFSAASNSARLLTYKIDNITGMGFRMGISF